MTTGKQGIVLGVIGLIFIGLFVGNIAYQTFWPREVAVFHAVTVPPGVYHKGDIVKYTVDVDKLYFTPSTVVRDIICMKGVYQILPNERGESQIGHYLFKRHFIIPDLVEPPDMCILRSTFSYETINQYHSPLKYVVDSNEFPVVP